MAAVAKVIEHYTCPISQQILVDPVVAQDGVIYERRCIERWLKERKSSPVTNQEMGPTLLSSIAALQVVANLVEEGLVDADAALDFFVDRGRSLAVRKAPSGPDLQVALADFRRALALAKTHEQRKEIEFQIKLVSWMQEGLRLVTELQGLQAHDTCGEGVADVHQMNVWMTQVGDVVRSALLASLGKEQPMARWWKLSIGTRVKVMDNVDELMRLCKRPAPGAQGPVKWLSSMSSWAGAVCVVRNMGVSETKGYRLELEADSSDSYIFPFDALILLGKVSDLTPADVS